MISNYVEKALSVYHIIPTFNDPEKESLSKNIVRKGENAGNQYFFLFPQYFLPFLKQSSIFESQLFCCRQSLPFWTGLKFCCVVMSYILI